MSFQRPRIYTHIKFANNAKTNHIMVSLLIWSAKDRWKYTKSCFKENARTCSKNSTTQGNIRISGLKKRLRNLYEKKFKPEIKPIIKNLQDELYQLENKQGKGAKLRATIRWKLEGKKCKVLERKNIQNQTRSEFIVMIINQNILASLLTFSNL